MFGRVFFFKSLVFFLYRIFSFGKHRNNASGGGGGLHRSASQLHSPTTTTYLHPNSKYQRLSSLANHKPDLSNQTLLLDLEGTLLISPSPFPYFMLVAFEAGSVVRALVLLLLYPLVALVSQEMGIKIMVMVCFFGIRKGSFRVGSAVLPKYFLEDVGFEGFEVMRKFKKKVGVSSFPRVMVESFLRDYLAVDVVIGRELKVVGGYFVGVMEKMENIDFKVEEIQAVGEELTFSRGNNVVGVSSFKKSLVHHQLFSQCKEIYLVTKADKRSWHQLPTNKYPKPLIFHDGRLALRPDPVSIVALLMWAPFGVALSVLRVAIGISLPYNLSLPIIIFTGVRFTVSKPTSSSNPRPEESNKGLLYVCNHRTLLDPLYLAFANKKELTALTYSLSRVSEILSPIKTVRLTRDRVKDAEMMERLLNQGDLVVCPEGTTCREPYLLRFSPLFAEMSDEIVPVAVDSEVDWFHGTTAGGLKCFDPLFFFMNPRPSYTMCFLEKVYGSSTCLSKTRFEVANHVQGQIGKVLGFECTGFTRKDKYLVLAGNEGLVNNKT